MISWLSQMWVQRLGWTLVHFLWQGTAIALLYTIVSRLAVPRRSARLRYGLACATLGAMVAAPLLTLVVLSGETGMQGSHAAWWTISAATSKLLLPGVVLIWSTGVLVFSMRLFVGLRLTRRLRSTAHPAPDEWQQVLGRLCGPGRTVGLLVSSLVDVPAVVGWLKPAILVPVEFLTGLPAGYITALLAHELAHVERRDYLVNVLQSVAEAVLFYHPAVWWISDQIRDERELCCDDLAVAASGDAATYVRALAELESRQATRMSPALAATGGSLVKRVQRLLEPARGNERNLPGPAAAWAMILLWISGIGVAAMHAAPTRAVVPAVAEIITAPVAPPASRSPFAELAGHARNTLLTDPIVSAQLAQPQSQTEAAKVEEIETPWRKWLNEDVAYIITDSERGAFRQLTTDEERAQFVEQFWLRRDPSPGTVENEYKEEHYRRIAYANERFSSDLPGWKTDRGRIYIMFGPPDEIDSHPSGGTYQRPAAEGGGQTTTFPFEDWRYRYIEGIGNDITTEFVDTRMNGEYHMTMDPSEKDALKYVPGVNTQAPPTNQNQFERLNQFVQLQQPPDVKFKELEDAIGKPITYTVLPMRVRVDYLWLTQSSALTNVSLQFESRDLHFQSDGNKSWATVNIVGRISSTTRRPVATFEYPLEVHASDGPHAVYQKSVPLAPGRYRLDIVAKDAAGGNMNFYQARLDVPELNTAGLSSSSLILADAMEKIPAKAIIGSMFTIGDTKVRPHLGNEFTRDEAVGFYLQVYNFMPDPVTQKPSGWIEYRIEKDGLTDVDFSEEIGSIANASANQVTIAKWLPPRNLEPGRYTLHLTATDRNRNQTVQQSAYFTISPR